MTLLTLVWNRPTSKRPRIFKPPYQYQHSEHYFSKNWVKTSILNKDVPQDNIQLDLGQQARQVVQQQVPVGTKNTIVFKIEQTKIQEYFRQKNKDTILSLDFICRIDDLVRTNNWSETVTFSNVANTLRGFAPTWLFSTVDALDYMADQESIS